jgi:hypothetical protein
MRSRPSLVVPIRDRRQRRRILTLKNFRKFVLGVAIFFLGVTIQSDLRHPPSGSYGRLFSKQVFSQADAPRQKVEVVREAPVIDQTAADPLLLAPAAREQYLGVNGPLQRANVEPALSRFAPAGEPALRDLAIVGGPDGVAIVRGEATKRPTLSGGIFRQ